MLLYSRTVILLIILTQHTLRILDTISCACCMGLLARTEVRSSRCWGGILVKIVIHQIWPQKNWKLHSVWFWCISDMVLYLLRWEKQGASLNFVPTHLFGKIQDFFVPGTYWQFLLKSHAKAWISFARPWKSHYNLQIKHTNWKNAFAFKFSIRFDFFGRKVNW